jgi:hypothetical protein
MGLLLANADFLYVQLSITIEHNGKQRKP